MTGLTSNVLGRDVDTRRRWRRRWLGELVNGATLLLLCVALWVGLVSSVAQPDPARPPSGRAELRL